MIIELATKSDLKCIMEIYQSAIQYMNANGNPNQWINGYPGEDVVINDIDLKQLYLCKNEQNEIVAVFCYFVGEEETYSEIYEGQWMNNNPYGVIHRIASNGKVKRIADYCINWCFTKHPNMKIDTHEDNITMQNVIKRCGFQYCGIIKCSNGSLRLAYQKI
ncbi:MAG: GNAT family N-acetyltransferase [Rikenellaceae bacterium]